MAASSTSRNSALVAGALGVLLWLAAWAAGAAPAKVSLLLGDLDSYTALQAVKLLREDPALRDVAFRVYPTSGFEQADRSHLRDSRLVFVLTVGRRLVMAAEPELRAVAQRGGKVYAVGATYDEDFKAIGIARDELLRDYMAAGGVANVANMLRSALARDMKRKVTADPPQPIPEVGMFDVATGRIYQEFEAYARDYTARDPARAEKPWVGILFYRSSAVSGQTAPLAAVVRALEAQGLRAAPVFGYPSELAIERFLIDAGGRARVRALVGMAMKIGVTPHKSIPLLARLDVPVLNAITLNTQTRAQWEASPAGLDIMERAWQLAGAEFGGLIAPTVIASKERMTDPETGIEYVIEQPIDERVARLAARAKRWVDLRYEMNSLKRVAVVYYNYPPGKHDIGASYLNVLPDSLWQITTRLTAEGYDTRSAPADPATLFEHIHEHGSNIGSWAPGQMEKLVRSGQATLLPVTQYRTWFEALPPVLKDSMIRAWGPPEDAKIMTWRDPKGRLFFVFPTRQYGKLLFAPQPSRGWYEDVKKLYHDVHLPPHHQYMAFYLWLQKGFKAHAMLHVGTHATHEWQMGKEAGYTAADPGEVLVADVPQLYFFIMDDIGEGLQAKRRGMATLISYLTPPLDAAGLNPELAQLKGLINDYHVAEQKSEAAAAAILEDVDRLARKVGLTTDLGLERVEDHEQVEALEHYLKETGEKHTPFGMHTLGVPPSEPMRLATADAVLSLDVQLTGAERDARRLELARRMEDGSRAELDAMIAGLAGRYVQAGPGSDPIRNPDALPSGRNLYGFDPSRMPTQATYAQGERLAQELLRGYRERHRAYPDKLVFNLWGVESSRHEGVMEAQIMSLMGVRPRWDERGRVVAVEVIAREELGRPRVDVTIVPSGLYRDLFAQLIKLLDEAVSAVKDLDEEDNPIRANVARTRQALIERGIPAEEAGRLAAVRLFSVPSGAYGTNLDRVIPLSNTWQNEAQVADVYFMRMSHLYGQGQWGTQPGSPSLAVDLLKLAFKDAKMAVHSRSSNVYATLDSDDFYQYLGGTALAMRQVNGRTPEVYVTNLANPKAPQNETLEKYMGRELRTRYVNPKWIQAMLAEGYAGTRFVNKVVEHLWGWQVTVPEAVDAAKWQEMYETYVVDRHNLGIREKFREAKNMLAYQAMVDRMLVAVNKGYWKPDSEVVEKLQATNLEVIAEAGVACYRDTCSSPEITALAEQQDRATAQAALRMPAPRLGAAPTVRSAPPPPAPAAAPSGGQAPPAASTDVAGFEMQEERRTRLFQPPPPLPLWLAALFALLAVAGFASGGRLRRAA